MTIIVTPKRALKSRKYANNTERRINARFYALLNFFNKLVWHVLYVHLSKLVRRFDKPAIMPNTQKG